jgi:Zinc finger, C3HC4 type (RING finger)
MNAHILHAVYALAKAGADWIGAGGKAGDMDGLPELLERASYGTFTVCIRKHAYVCTCSITTGCSCAACNLLSWVAASLQVGAKAGSHSKHLICHPGWWCTSCGSAALHALYDTWHIYPQAKEARRNLRACARIVQAEAAVQVPAHTPGVAQQGQGAHIALAASKSVPSAGGGHTGQQPGATAAAGMLTELDSRPATAADTACSQVGTCDLLHTSWRTVTRVRRHAARRPRGTLAVSNTTPVPTEHLEDNRTPDKGSPEVTLRDIRLPSDPFGAVTGAPFPQMPSKWGKQQHLPYSVMPDTAAAWTNKASQAAEMAESHKQGGFVENQGREQDKGDKAAAPAGVTALADMLVAARAAGFVTGGPTYAATHLKDRRSYQDVLAAMIKARTGRAAKAANKAANTTCKPSETHPSSTLPIPPTGRACSAEDAAPASGHRSVNMDGRATTLATACTTAVLPPWPELGAGHVKATDADRPKAPLFHFPPPLTQSCMLYGSDMQHQQAANAESLAAQRLNKVQEGRPPQARKSMPLPPVSHTPQLAATEKPDMVVAAAGAVGPGAVRAAEAEPAAKPEVHPGPGAAGAKPPGDATVGALPDPDFDDIDALAAAINAINAPQPSAAGYGKKAAKKARRRARQAANAPLELTLGPGLKPPCVERSVNWAVQVAEQDATHMTGGLENDGDQGRAAASKGSAPRGQLADGKANVDRVQGTSNNMLDAATSLTAMACANVSDKVSAALDAGGACIPDEGNAADGAHSSADDDSGSCIVCMERRRDALLLPCKHLALCAQCAGSLAGRGWPNGCPFCRAPVHECVEVLVP